MKIGKIIYLILIGVLLIMVISVIIISIENIKEKENFCNERGMIYEYESGFYELGNCLKIDNQRKIVESFKIKKINEEYYL